MTLHAFGQLVDDYRKEKGYSVKHVCAELGVGVSTYYKWKYGDSKVTEWDFYRLCDYLSIPDIEYEDLERYNDFK